MDETTPGSITIAIQKAQAGDADEFTELVNRHQQDIERMARYFLGGERKSNLMLGDDIMQSVFLQLWQGLSGGKTWFVKAVTDREQLFSVLGRLTWLRVSKALRHANQEMRRGTIRDSDVESETGDRMSSSFEYRSEAEMVVEISSMIEEIRLKLAALGDDVLVSIFEDWLRETKTDETADRIGISRRSVERKRAMIRKMLNDWMDKECREFGRQDDKSE